MFWRIKRLIFSSVFDDLTADDRPNKGHIYIK